VYCVFVLTCYALLIYTTDDILNDNDKLLNTVDKVEVYILWLKLVKSAHTDSAPLLVLVNIPTIGIRAAPSSK
jgi:hypothetical protein